MVWHSNGRLYATDNDMDIEDDLGCGSVANDFGCTCASPVVDPGADELNLVEPGMYYGSANPYLANPSGLQCQGGSNATFACTTNANCPGGTCQDLTPQYADVYTVDRRDNITLQRVWKGYSGYVNLPATKDEQR